MCAVVIQRVCKTCTVQIAKHMVENVHRKLFLWTGRDFFRAGCTHRLFTCLKLYECRYTVSCDKNSSCWEIWPLSIITKHNICIPTRSLCLSLTLGGMIMSWAISHVASMKRLIRETCYLGTIGSASYSCQCMVKACTEPLLCECEAC